MSSAAAVAKQPEESDEAAELRQQLKQAHTKIRHLRVLYMGMKADADEAMGSFRLQRAIHDFKTGLKESQECIDDLEKLLRDKGG